MFIRSKMKNDKISKNAIAVSVDCVIFGYNDEGLKVLLMESDLVEFKGLYSLVGKILEPDQTLTACAQEVLLECARLKKVNLNELGTYSDLDRHPFGRVITVVYYSLLKISEHEIIDLKNRGLKWMPLTLIGNLAFDHNKILEDCINDLRKKMIESPTSIGMRLMPKKFKLNTLQKMYESIFQQEYDKRNFRRKMLSSKSIVDINEREVNVSHRPAKLYSFNQESLSRNSLI